MQLRKKNNELVNTDFFESPPDHKCGTVMDFCTYNDIKIFFCIYCKKIITAKREPEIQISISLKDDVEMDEYDDETLEDLR